MTNIAKLVFGAAIAAVSVANPVGVFFGQRQQTSRPLTPHGFHSLGHYPQAETT